MEHKLRKESVAGQKSACKQGAGQRREKVKSKWPDRIAKLAGSWQDEFPDLDEIRSSKGLDVNRKKI